MKLFKKVNLLPTLLECWRFLLREVDLWRLFKVTFAAGIFLIPLKIQSLVYSSNSYLLGFFDEFSSFFIHISEILFIASFVFLGLSFIFEKRESLDIKIERKYAFPFLFLLAASSVVVLFASDSFLALLYFWRTLILFSVAAVIGLGLFDRFLVIKILAAAFLAQALLGIGQYIAGGDLGLHFFGESFFDTQTFNVAKIALTSGETVVRGMGTLAHANILGGLLAIVLLFLTAYPRKKIAAYFVSVLLLIGLFFTFSRAAYLAFFVGLAVLTIFQFRRRIASTTIAGVIFAVLVFFFAGSFSARLEENSVGIGRVAQVYQAVEIASENPTGVGRGSYMTVLAATNPELKNWQFQPVHNFFVLKLVEESALVILGWLALFVFLAIWCFQEKKFEALAVIIGLLVLANFDHYLVTSFAGSALLWLALAFVVSELASKKRSFIKK